MLSRLLIPMILGALSAPPAAEEAAFVFHADPVELLRGNDVTGSPDITATHYRFRYQFINTQNRDAFLANPQRYEIQLGGACGRMGALSGRGTTFIYATYDDKLYIFASEECKQTFLKDPQKVLDLPDAIPAGAPEAMAQGRALIARAVEAAGGAARIDTVTSYRYTTRKHTTWRNETHEAIDMRTVDLTSGSYRRDQIWGDEVYSLGVTPAGGWQADPTGSFPLHAQQCAAARKTYVGRNIIAILQARQRDDFVAVHLGPFTLEHAGRTVPLERVAVHLHAATTVLGIDPSTGAIVTLSYRGRGPDLTYGQVTRVYTSYLEEGGLHVPEWYDFTMDGVAHALPPFDQRRISVNVELQPDFFDRPSKPKP